MAYQKAATAAEAPEPDFPLARLVQVMPDSVAHGTGPSTDEETDRAGNAASFIIREGAAALQFSKAVSQRLSSRLR